MADNDEGRYAPEFTPLPKWRPPYPPYPPNPAEPVGLTD